jgi:hypothetical protein
MQQALTHIRTAWIAARISAGLTLLFVLLALSGTSIGGIDGGAFVDVGRSIQP